MSDWQKQQLRKETLEKHGGPYASAICKLCACDDSKDNFRQSNMLKQTCS